MIGIEICIDVPDLERGIRFYSQAFGFATLATPFPGVVYLKVGDTRITLLEKRSQSQASPHAADSRRYERHWTPVHLDFHVDDLDAALEQVIAAGATQEKYDESAEHPPMAVCADPFGHGFCLLQRPAP